jgi:histidinol-phosphatase (PHP family)
LSDYHLHLHAHGPYRGIGPPPGIYPEGHIESYVEKAVERGSDEVCFTEHLYRCVEAGPVLGRFWEAEPRRQLAEQTERFIAEDLTLSLAGYVDAVLAAKSRGLPVLLGLEVDFFPETIDAVLELIAPYPWDLLIGSIHWIGGWSLDHPEVVEEYITRGVDVAYQEYFALEAELAASGTVDVLAHADLIKVFGHRPDGGMDHLYTPVVEAAARSGTAVEVNTSGLRNLTGEIYPSQRFLELFHRAGVGITLASDAHSPADVCSGFEEGRALARQVGYSKRLAFSERVGRSIPL